MVLVTSLFYSVAVDGPQTALGNNEPSRVCCVSLGLERALRSAGNKAVLLGSTARSKIRFHLPLVLEEEHRGEAWARNVLDVLMLELSPPQKKGWCRIQD